MVNASKGLLDQSRVEPNRNYEGTGRAKSGRVFGKDPSLKSAWRGTSAIRGPVPKWVTAPPKAGRGHDFKATDRGPKDTRRHVTARLSYVPRGGKYVGKVAANAKYLGRRQAVDRDEGHETYLEREGPFFTKQSDGIKAGQVAKSCENDPRQFRLIINPDDGNRLSVGEMKQFVREYMEKVEHAVGARIAWAAVIHKADTTARENNRHAHVIIRGKDLDGNVLRFAKPFVKEGFRSIARDMMTEKFGPLNERELSYYRERFERNQERNREWKRMEREGATMAEKRAFAKEWHSREQARTQSQSRARQHDRSHSAERSF